MNDVLEEKLDVFEAQLVAKELKKKYPILTVAFCKGMTCNGLAWEILRELGGEVNNSEIYNRAVEVAKAARLMPK